MQTKKINYSIVVTHHYCHLKDFPCDKHSRLGISRPGLRRSIQGLHSEWRDRCGLVKQCLDAPPGPNVDDPHVQNHTEVPRRIFLSLHSSVLVEDDELNLA